jgi:hypothetical protein
VNFICNFSAKAVDLCPARDTGFEKLPDHIVVHPFGKRFSMLDHVRAWSNKAHVTYQDIKKLRELIETGPAQKST